ncbi:hypothetical protein JOB18_013120 [Solea senegalensis]|uniref:Uncharacterized protein n=1 Tax=Solea senegalensis TaxID=28829 RepID=A0AAV6T512_SOLSE|nr:hypothetical protein JOB18_013120 [Solea senegalensis]
MSLSPPLLRLRLVSTVAGAEMNASDKCSLKTDRLVCKSSPSRYIVSPVRLHLARTHQQGHKANKRPPLNLVQHDGRKGPKKRKKRESVFLKRTQEDCDTPDYPCAVTAAQCPLKHGEDKGAIRFGPEEEEEEEERPSGPDSLPPPQNTWCKSQSFV